MRKTKENFLDYCQRITNTYIENVNSTVLKSKGQFFTHKELAEFMSDLFTIDQEKKQVNILDPGAGTGILSSALSLNLLESSINELSIEIDAFENDKNIIQFLNQVFKELQKEFEKENSELVYNIIEKDFITDKAESFNGYNKNIVSHDHQKYDYIIANPPYYKINKDSVQSKAMKDLIYGQPNIYALFIALSTCLLKQNGEEVFITPRSFCSGSYYKKFREWFLRNINLTHIHNFRSRKNVFESQSVLQENIIFKASKESNAKKITISLTDGMNFENMIEFKARKSRIIFKNNGETFIRVPSSPRVLKLLSNIDDLKNKLANLDLDISTGPVVPFRSRKYLKSDYGKKNTVPLLWMHNVKDFKTVWPLKKNEKEIAIELSNKSKSILLPVKNYVLVKRFTSKEQKRRLYAGVLDKSEYEDHDYIGIENHLNYIHRPGGEMSLHECYGIAGLLNSSIIDDFFRSLSGHTQVNATEIKSLPLPTLKKIKKIGEKICSQDLNMGSKLDEIVARRLNIEDELIKSVGE